MTRSDLLLILQLALFGLATGALGLVCGRYLWPRCMIQEASDPAPSPADELEPALSDLEHRLAASESLIQQLRRAVARASDDKGDTGPAS